MAVTTDPEEHDMTTTASTTTAPRQGAPVHHDGARRRTMRRALDLDIAVTGAVGLATAAAANPLATPLGIPSAWLLGLGLFMVAYAAELLVLRRAVIDRGRPSAPRWVRAVAAGNAGWVAASVAAVLLGAWDLTPAGVAVVLAQAVVVEVFANLQWRAAR